MHPEMPLLYDLHEVDAHLLQLERTLRNLDNGDKAKAALLATRQELARREEALKRARVTLGEAESSLEANEADQKAKTKLLYGGSVVKASEAEAVEHEIASLKDAASDLETTILETMDAIETAAHAVAEANSLMNLREEALRRILTSYQKESVALQEQINEAKIQRAAAAKPISPATLARYDSARKRTKDTGLALLDGNSCGGCHMQVPGVSVLQLSSTQDLISCDNCGRLLYRKP